MNGNNFNSGKRPVYKRWWFWLIIILAVFILIGSMSNNKNQSNTPENAGTADKISPTAAATITPQATPTKGLNTNTGNTGTTDGQVVEDKVADIKASAQRDNSAAKLTTLNTGNYIAGTDIPAGRYVVTGSGSGNFIITNKDGYPYVNEILGGADIGVKSVTTDIKDGDSIKISGMDKAVFTPAKTVLFKDYLTTGNWLVGTDVVPGRYDITSAGTNDTGNLIVYDKNGLPEVNEILGGDYGVKKVTADLKEGSQVVISGLNKVNLKSK